MLSEERISLSH